MDLYMVRVKDRYCSTDVISTVYNELDSIEEKLNL